ncbi:MAG: AhpC/TSA family protein [Prevotellaceae bacterium]|nr:AhpC/TSA family protein [Candidatus Minthosoma caballi]
MKKILPLIALFAFVLASCDNKPKFHVEGNITEAADSMLYLEQATLDGIQKIDSVKLGTDGSFSFKAAAPVGCPEFYDLRVGNHVINFSVDSTETITFVAKLPVMESDYTVEGSENSSKIKEISLMQQSVQAKLIAIEKSENLLPGDLIDSLNNVVDEYKERIKRDYIFQEPKSAYAYYAVCQSLTDLRGTFMLFNPVSNRDDVKCYATVATAWDGFYPDAPRTQQLCNMAIKGMDNTATPQQKVVQVDESKISESGIIDITLPDVNSKLHSIRDLKGKVVLLDFTIYGAKESLERTRMLRSLYERYHAQGFEIYQISLDDDVHFWKYSCENLPWICVHETDGTATNVYGIVNIPTFFLVNRSNEIVVRSDFMTGSLEDELLKLL